MILLDTGAIVAAALSDEEHHDVCARLLNELRLAGREMLVPATVLAEAGYMLRTAGTPSPRRVSRRLRQVWSKATAQAESGDRNYAAPYLTPDTAVNSVTVSVRQADRAGAVDRIQRILRLPVGAVRPQ